MDKQKYHLWDSTGDIIITWARIAVDKAPKTAKVLAYMEEMGHNGLIKIAEGGDLVGFFDKLFGNDEVCSVFAYSDNTLALMC